MTHHFARVAAAVALTGAIAGCSDGTSRTVTRSVEVGSAKSVDVDLGFGAGELRVSGGARALLDARFEISGDDPAVDYAVNNGEGRLRVGPSKGSSGIGGGAGEWDLHLQNGVPMSLKVSTGAGETHLDLGTRINHPAIRRDHPFRHGRRFLVNLLAGPKQHGERGGFCLSQGA